MERLIRLEHLLYNLPGAVGVCLAPTRLEIASRRTWEFVAASVVVLLLAQAPSLRLAGAGATALPQYLVAVSPPMPGYGAATEAGRPLLSVIPRLLERVVAMGAEKRLGAVLCQMSACAAASAQAQRQHRQEPTLLALVVALGLLS
jgi:hypothetical protein